MERNGQKKEEKKNKECRNAKIVTTNGKSILYPGHFVCYLFRPALSGIFRK
jgi:hypothetical protein